MDAAPLEPPTSDDQRRQRARALRRDLTGGLRADAEHRIAARLLELDEMRRPGSIALSLPTDGEVDLRSVVAPLRERGWRLLLPVIGAARTMELIEWAPDAPLVPNRFGVLEPAPGTGSVTSVDDLDVVVLPCVAVDERGNRLGFGAGYYDRLLEPSAARDEGARPLRVGAVFDVQMTDLIEPAPWDVPLDVVVTESRVLRPG